MTKSPTNQLYPETLVNKVCVGKMVWLQDQRKDKWMNERTNERYIKWYIGNANAAMVLSTARATNPDINNNNSNNSSSGSSSSSSGSMVLCHFGWDVNFRDRLSGAQMIYTGCKWFWLFKYLSCLAVCAAAARWRRVNISNVCSR